MLHHNFDRGIVVLMTDEETEKFQAAADTEGLSVSAWKRNCCRRAVGLPSVSEGSSRRDTLKQPRRRIDGIVQKGGEMPLVVLSCGHKQRSKGMFYAHCRTCKPE